MMRSGSSRREKEMRPMIFLVCCIFLLSGCDTNKGHIIVINGGEDCCYRVVSDECGVEADTCSSGNSYKCATNVVFTQKDCEVKKVVDSNCINC
jgi:hypothetical protein